ncbi:MAG: NAD-glutamate dehydrogenase, partial [Leptospiraceae bacterium]|nr:NAD-glutamate dehydrogenase [Leptospiraceae bacterium]
EYGITAKGALVTADRRLRNLGLDLLQDPITVVGIGDLGGDVFGNGLIFSKYLKLVAAFNHKHIFLDPNPDLEKSYAERVRLFHSKNAGWDQYNKEIISKGGGVFEKTEKAIPISPEVKQVLGITEDVLSGTALIRAILKAPVDLFYNGGIGTYVKSENEDNSEVGDPTNNEYRINGNEVQAKVVCEGGNLGFTQLGRIEYAIKGGMIYTDAIDNSAGVDLSDHEVNLKLFFSHLLTKGIIKDDRERDVYLKEIAHDVCEKVLLDNNLQSLSLNVDEYESKTLGWNAFIQVSNYFISKSLLNPITEKVPSNATEWQELKEKTTQVPMPILCVLLAYAKMDLYNEAVESEIFKVEEFENIYNFYFPNLLVTKFSNYLKEHPLKKEILLTQLVNFYINLTGSTGILLLSEKDKKERLKKLHEILVYLNSNHFFEFLNELSSIRNKNLEHENPILLSKIRERLRLKWIVTSKLDLNEFQVTRSISPKIVHSMQNI